MAGTVDQARTAFARQDWSAAFSSYVSMPERTDLDASDYERLAVSAYLVGEDDESASAWEASYRSDMQADRPTRAARSAFWLAMCLMLRGQSAQAGGWLRRAERLAEEGPTGECPASGLVLIPRLLASIEEGDLATALEVALEVTEVARRSRDADLHALATLGHGQVLIAQGDLPEGIALLDDAMVAVAASEVGPMASGIVYCAVILECMRVFDLHRAVEWTDALSTWCEGQPDLVPYRGQCLVHRSQLQQLSGDWPGASTTASAALSRLADPPHPAFGLACYQHAELLRLVGAHDEAADAYGRASRHGHASMPGLALLQLDRGDVAGAARGIRRALQECTGPTKPPALLSAAVDILRASGDVAAARVAADELVAIASASSSDVLAAMADQADGSVLIAEGSPVAGLAQLRRAALVWQAERMPYEAAKGSMLRGLGCAAVGDLASAGVELDNARDTFAELGAITDGSRASALVDSLGSDADSLTRGDHALSAREREVLTQLAAGKTNKEIAAILVISQHTVARHLEHIFAKLDVTNRAAATAYAYEHGLV